MRERSYIVDNILRPATSLYRHTTDGVRGGTALEQSVWVMGVKVIAGADEPMELRQKQSRVRKCDTRGVEK